MPIPPRAVLAAWVVIGEADGSLARLDAFSEGLETGANLGDNDIRLRARNLFFNRAAAQRRADSRSDMAILIKSWNCYVSGRSLGVLRYSSDSAFPEVLV